MKKNSFAIILFLQFFFFSAYCQNYAGFDYVRPLPDKFHILPPPMIVDLFSFAVAMQTHAPLFKINGLYGVEPYLVDSFEVTDDGREYRFKLKNALFHDGSKLTAKDVKNCFEFLIKTSTVSYESLINIQGVSSFLEKQKKEVVGIVVINDSEFKIILNKKDPKLINKLAEPRFSIWKKNKDKVLGLGMYKVQKNNEKYLVMVRHYNGIKKHHEYAPKNILFVVLRYEKAVEFYLDGKVSDLFFYKLKKKDIDRIRTKSKYSNVSFPRTYSFVLNSKNVEYEKRKFIFNKLNVQNIVSKCFNGEKATNNLIPPSFIGFDENMKKNRYSTVKNVKFKKPLKIAVIRSIGSEECLVNSILKQLGTIPAEVYIENLSKLGDLWINGKLDGKIAYFESEIKSNYFDTFNPNLTYLQGDHESKKYFDLYHQFEYETSLIKKDLYAKKFADYIMSRATILPFFHYKHELMYQKKYIFSMTENITAVQIPLSSVRVSQ